MNNKTEDKIDIYKIDNKNEMLEYYKNWSNNYNKDMVDWNYVAPTRAIKLFVKYVVDKESFILDAGCGTGAVGKSLKELGYYNIDGLDFSQSMLNLVPIGIYNDLILANLNESLNIQLNKYDSVICVGTLTFGHVKPHSLLNIIKIIKPGGYFCFTINEGVYKKYKFDKTIFKFESDSIFKIKEKIFDDYIVNKQVKSWNFIVEIL